MNRTIYRTVIALSLSYVLISCSAPNHGGTTRNTATKSDTKESLKEGKRAGRRGDKEIEKKIDALDRATAHIKGRLYGRLNGDRNNYREALSYIEEERSKIINKIEKQNIQQQKVK